MGEVGVCDVVDTFGTVVGLLVGAVALVADAVEGLGAEGDGGVVGALEVGALGAGLGVVCAGCGVVPLGRLLASGNDACTFCCAALRAVEACSEVRSGAGGDI